MRLDREVPIYPCDSVQLGHVPVLRRRAFLSKEAMWSDGLHAVTRGGCIRTPSSPVGRERKSMQLATSTKVPDHQSLLTLSSTDPIEPLE